ncbi:hypothetical protein HNP84_000424 [Thermocatellispora tengchongensis]|uniref:Uncharacterized protein n=1 Tax=Thermocatellispora tengchongensis TaxID=1073253 RepID=A0A840NX11_9ACTN|nr:hypothetical protein [Thermocatellispora tengchongensis]MBB5130736.1 hypothetical protein [Thermocatellispora tengchongensis]
MTGDSRPFDLGGEEVGVGALGRSAGGLRTDDPRIAPEDVQPIVVRAVTDVALAEIRQAAMLMSEADAGSREDVEFTAWARRMVAASLGVPSLGGTARGH